MNLSCLARAWTLGRALCLTALLTLPVAGDPAPELAGFFPKGARRQLKVEKRFLGLPSSESFRTHLERVTRDPHPFGSQANAEVAEYLARTMTDAGLEVERYTYDVYAPEGTPEVGVALVRPLRLPLNNQEYIVEGDPFSAHPLATHAWNAYSASGDVTGEVVYVNFGRREDFQRLADLGVSLEGRIAVARYGGNYRGFKVKYAEEAGAIGVLIYSDPANGGYTGGAVYPEGKYWSESTIQRGSVKTLAYPGDPLTPLEPARAAASGLPVERLSPEDVALPRIPVTPLPYGSAAEILSRMQGEPVPRDWQGALPFTYRVTGGPGLTVRLRVDQPKGLVPATNIVGRLRGSEFPDEWIILGCHYDAWTFGATDPNGGTAMLLTLAEALGELARKGHRPRRSILICHWDAEEFGIMGSIEWVEDLRAELGAKGVAYINADMCVTGPSFGASSSPSLRGPIVAASRAVVHPDDDRTVFEHWLKQGAEEPGLGNLGGGSDHLGFYTHVGIPSAGLGMGGASLYHSLYDSYAFFERFCDPQFVYGPAMARIDGILALRLANADVLPYDVGRYAVDLQRHLEGLEKRAGEMGVQAEMADLRAAIAELASVTESYSEARARYLAAGGTGDATEANALAALNRQLINLERALLRPEGFQYSSWPRSLYAGPDPYSGYACWLLPPLRYEIEAANPAGIDRWQAICAAAVRQLAEQAQRIAATLAAGAN